MTLPLNPPPVLDPACPLCNTQMIFDSANHVHRCRKCGHRIAYRAEMLEEAEIRIAAQNQNRPVVRLTTRGEVNARARSVFETGHDHLARGNPDAAMSEWLRAGEIQPDFVDPALWIAKTTRDETIKREQLGIVLANDPGNLEALRLLMVMNGQMTPEQAARPYDDSQAVQLHEWQGVEGEAEADVLLCPACGGHLSANAAMHKSICDFCGHEEAITAKTGRTVGTTVAGVVGAALLLRKADPVRWIIGDWMMHCEQCGADRTIPAGRISGICPFCGSSHVIRMESLPKQMIQQPEGLIPFILSETIAQAAIRERLRGIDERLAGLFDENRVARATLEGVFLPYWLFDALLEVTITVTRQSSLMQHRRAQLRYPTAFQSRREMAGVNGLGIPAVISPSRNLLDPLGEFALETMTGYDPRLLADMPAALYDIDVDDASLTARTRAAARIRDQHMETKRDDETMSVMAGVLQMSYMLVLVPIWIATLYERDGDVRTAIVHGQTGKVALGKALKGEKQRR